MIRFVDGLIVFRRSCLLADRGSTKCCLEGVQGGDSKPADNLWICCELVILRRLPPRSPPARGTPRTSVVDHAGEWEQTPFMGDIDELIDAALGIGRLVDY